jgi:hypothetical protein
VIGNDRKAISEKVNSIEGTDGVFAEDTQIWAEKSGNAGNSERARMSTGGMGIVIDNSQYSNIGTQNNNSDYQDGVGGSAITLLHATTHSSPVIRGTGGRTGYGLGDAEGHTNEGITADGNSLRNSFARGGANEVLKQNNLPFIQAVKNRYGTNKKTDNYERNKEYRSYDDFIGKN